MKINVSNLSSSTMVLPAPLAVSLTGGQSKTLSVSASTMKAIQQSKDLNRLQSKRLISIGVMDEAPAQAAPAPVAPPAPPPQEDPAPEAAETAFFAAEAPAGAPELLTAADLPDVSAEDAQPEESPKKGGKGKKKQ